MGGYSSGVTTSGGLIFTEASEFERFWKSHTSILDPKPSLPEIDFDRNMVGFVSRGEQPTGGYHIEVQSIEESDELKVIIQTEDPCEGCMVTQELTQPYHLFQINKSNDAITDKSTVFEIKSHNVEPSKEYPMFVLGYEAETIDDPFDIEKLLMELDEVEDVEILSGVQMIFVHINEKVEPNPCKAKEAVLFVVGEMTDVSYLEADPQERTWVESCDEVTTLPVEDSGVEVGIVTSLRGSSP